MSNPALENNARAAVKIPFNRPYMTGQELDNIGQAYRDGWLAGGGGFTARCQQSLQDKIGGREVILTHSCTAALEMAALLLEIRPGDEVIMPSFTFVSTANPFVLRGGVPVFVDIRDDTLNIDERRIEAAVTPRTRAIVVVHYAGVACEMDAVMAIAARHDLLVIEDAAHGIMAAYHDQALGTIGQLGALSFHETKNIICGEGGALIINDERYCQRAAVLAEKGTNRRRFFKGEIDKYSWVDVGSSYLPSELNAAFLWAQLQDAEQITAARLAIWETYQQAFQQAEQQGWLRRPVVPPACRHNAHMYYLLLPDEQIRQGVLEHCRAQGIGAVFHYVPLHDSAAGLRYGRISGGMRVTEAVSGRLLRLPLWLGVERHQDFIVHEVLAALAKTRGGANQD